MGVLSREEDPHERQMERQEENQEHMTNLSAAQQRNQQMFADDGSLQQDYVREIVGSDLEQGTIDLMSNLLTKDFILANLSDAEVHEIRWLTRVSKLKILSMHPNKHSIWEGEFRKVCADNERQALPHLSDRQREIIDQVVMGVIAHVSRAKDGFQQEKFNESVSVSERRQNEDDDSEGWF